MYFRLRGLTYLQEVTTLTARYLEHMTPESRQVGETSAVSIPRHRESHPHRFQGSEREISYNACPHPLFCPFWCLAHGHRSQKAPICPPRDLGFDVQGSQFPQGCSIAPSAQGNVAGLSLPASQLALAQAEMGFKAASEGKQLSGKEQLCSLFGGHVPLEQHIRNVWVSN